MDWKTRLALHKQMKNINEYNTLRVREQGGTDFICILIKECNIPYIILFDPDGIYIKPASFQVLIYYWADVYDWAQKGSIHNVVFCTLLPLDFENTVLKKSCYNYYLIG